MEEFKILEMLGNGMQGKSYLVENIVTKQEFVMKMIECMSEFAASIAFEETFNLYKSLKEYSHLITMPICMFVHWDATVSSFFLCIVKRFLKNGDLRAFSQIHIEQKKSIPELVLRRFMGEMIYALKNIHAKGVIHQSIKSTNVLIDDDGKIVFTDFCVPSIMNDVRNRTRNPYGSFTTTSPELVVPGNKPDQKCDVWSLGSVLLRILLTSYCPSEEVRGLQLQIKFNQNAAQDILELASKNFSRELFDFIGQLLIIDKEKRITIEGMEKVPYVQRVLREMDEERERILDGEFIPINREETQLIYYMGYLKENHKSRLCLREFLNIMHDLITEAWAYFSLQSPDCIALLKHCDYYFNEEEIATSAVALITKQVPGLEDDKFFTAGPVSKIIELVQRYPESETLLKCAVKIFNAARISNDALKVLSEQGALKVLQKCLIKLTKDEEHIFYCLNVLWSLLSERETLIEMARSKGISKVLEVMDIYKMNRDIFHVGCLSLFGLSMHENCIKQFSDLNGIVVVLQGLMLHKADPKVVIDACLAISSLVENDEEVAYRLSQTNTTETEGIVLKGIAIIVDITNDYKQNREVVFSTMSLLLLLTNYDDIISEMKCSKVDASVNYLKEAYCDDFKIHQLCDRVLKKIVNLKPLVSWDMI